MVNRERFYEFVFLRNGEEARVLVRAWSADEAEDSIRQVLEAEGVPIPRSLIATPTGRSRWSRRPGEGLNRFTARP